MAVRLRLGMAPRSGSSSAHAHLHDMILFEDERDLHQRMAPYVREAARSGRVFTAITAHPAKDRRFLAGIAGAAGGRRKPRLFVYDAKELLVGSSDPTAAFSELWDEMEKQHEPVRQGWTNIGCFVDEFYSRLSIVIDMERILNRRLPPADIFCYYSDKGFSSLEPKQILELFELHDNVRFPGAVFSEGRLGRGPNA